MTLSAGRSSSPPRGSSSRESVGPAPTPLRVPEPPAVVAHWLAKSEPGVYSYSDLERDTKTEWNGVHNALALQHLKRMRPGDGLLFYHSGAERAVVGIARIASIPHPDPEDDRGSWSVEVPAGPTACADPSRSPSSAGTGPWPVSTSSASRDSA